MFRSDSSAVPVLQCRGGKLARLVGTYIYLIISLAALAALGPFRDNREFSKILFTIY